MNDYILLYISGDTPLKYRTPVNGWKPVMTKPASTRLTLLGSMEATYGRGGLKIWMGRIRCRVSPETGFGSPDDLEAVLMHRGSVVFVDHNNVSHTVHITGGVEEHTFTPGRYNANNPVDYNVQMTEAI
ncbi:MAG: hypothetical protein KQI81_08995 [Deltaproteobacteria bacterium]|nr:hypothetical protein [Deltaproteobacteria bacterium]